jgi:GAF domain-containing protein
VPRGATAAKGKAGTRPRVAKKSQRTSDRATPSLKTRLARALEQQAATSEILRVISASPTGIEPVLHAVAERAAILCKAPFARVLLIDGDKLMPQAEYSAEGGDPIRSTPVPLERTSLSGRAMVERRTVHIADIVPLLDSEFPDARANALRTGFRAVLAVPLMREENAYGAIFLWRRKPGLFAPDQVALVETFARQIAIAIDNVRLFKATKEALEQQTATSNVLKVISSSTFDLQPVLDTVVESAARLCGAEHAHIHRYDGKLLRLAAGFSGVPAMLDYLRDNPLPLGPGTISGLAGLERRVIHWHDVLEYPGYQRGEAQRIAGFRTMLGVPMLSGEELLGVIVIWKKRVEPFTNKQIELVTTFADQAVIAIQNVRLFTELQDRNREVTEALEQQTATSEILRVISQSPTDAQPAFEIIVDAAMKLCNATSANIFTYDGSLIHLAAARNVNAEYVEQMRGSYPRPPGRESGVCRAVMSRSVVAIPDVLADPDYDPTIAAIGATSSFRSVLAVPLMREGLPIGGIAIGRSDTGAFPARQVALLQTFADQAVIAIENVRLFRELQARNHDLTEALEQQTATSEILRVISSSPGDVKPMLDAVAERALKLCAAAQATIVLVDGGALRCAAAFGETRTLREGELMPLTPGSVAGRAIHDGAPFQIEDLATAPEEVFPVGRELQRRIGHHTALAVPLMREDRAIGAIQLWRMEIRAFSEKQVALVKTFADQAAIAIQNVRLFNELEARNREISEALEQQTATSEILRVISRSPTDVQPVFDTIAAATLKLCAANTTIVATFDGELIHVGALANLDPRGADAIRAIFPRPPSHDNATARAVLTRDVVVIPDILEDPLYAVRPTALTSGFRSIIGVPLLRDGNPIGAITVGRPEPGAFTDKQIALLRTFADQAVIAIENVRLFMELQSRTTELMQSVRELKALGEVGQAVSSTLDLETVLSTIVSRATQLAGMDGGAIYEYAEEREEFYLHTVDRLPRELVSALRSHPIRKGDGALGRLAVVGEPVEVRDVADEKAYQSSVRKILMKLGHRSLLAVPLLREGRLLGGLVVNRKSAGAFSPQVIDLLKTFAAQSALAIQNARLFREIEAKSRELEAASRHKSEFLANMSHELRTPLNAIIGFSEVLHERMFGEINEKQAEYLADILESGRHLLSLINDILDLSKIEAGRMELDPTEFSLPAAIDNALTLVRERAHRRAIELERRIAENIGMVCADERKVKQVILNLLSNALKFTPEGGRVAVRARAYDGWTEISVSDTGIGIAPEDQQTVFDEFRQVGSAARKVEGTGLGLAISRKFIELHGGRIWVTSKLGTGSTFAFTLPAKRASDAPA